MPLKSFFVILLFLFFTHFSSSNNSFFISSMVSNIDVLETIHVEVNNTSDTTTDNDAFITTWQVDQANGLVEIYTNPNLTYNYNIDWGDGTMESNLTGYANHAYAQTGVYTVSITGVFPHFATCQINDFDWIYECTNASKLQSIEQWGNQQWLSMSRALAYTTDQFVLTSAGAPDLQQVEDMSKMLWGSEANPILNNWEVNNVTNMQGLFRDATYFNQSLFKWDVSNVTNMNNMFNNASSFNQSIDMWNVSNVEMTMWMFDNATSFNQPLNSWDTSSLIDVNAMFLGATNFNQPLDNWDMSKVTNFYGMFRNTEAFNQPIGDWDVSSGESFGYMFSLSSSFNQPLNNWDVSNATQFRSMFQIAPEFNQPLGDWDVSNATNLNRMFQATPNFNQDISNWCVVQFSSEPLAFAQASLLQESYKPNWGANCEPLSANPAQDFAQSISIYPLPTKHDLKVEWSNQYLIENFIIYNLQGKVIQKISKLQGNVHTIEVDHLVSGKYFLEVNTKTNEKAVKVFVKN